MGTMAKFWQDEGSGNFHLVLRPDDSDVDRHIELNPEEMDVVSQVISHHFAD